MEIKQQLIASTAKTYTGFNPCSSITAHETANLRYGAGAQQHANLQTKGNVRDASWHCSVDDTEAIQSFPDSRQCWHAGDGAKPDGGNKTSWALEICVNVDSDFDLAVANAVDVIQQKMRKFGIPLSRVYQGVHQHNHWSGKNCPTFLRSGSRGITWDEFLSMVNGSAATPTTNPKPTTKPAPSGGFSMASLPRLVWTSNSTNKNEYDGRVQGLLAAAGVDPGMLDDYAGPFSRAALAVFQRMTNSGDGKGNADYFVGAKTWESLLTGKRW